VGEAGVTEDIPLFFTWIPILALLSNYDQEICLIHVGTEGVNAHGQLGVAAVMYSSSHTLPVNSDFNLSL
jgi:hypothetical protein